MTEVWSTWVRSHALQPMTAKVTAKNYPITCSIGRRNYHLIVMLNQWRGQIVWFPLGYIKWAMVLRSFGCLACLEGPYCIIQTSSVRCLGRRQTFCGEGGGDVKHTYIAHITFWVYVPFIRKGKKGVVVLTHPEWLRDGALICALFRLGSTKSWKAIYTYGQPSRTEKHCPIIWAEKAVWKTETMNWLTRKLAWAVDTHTCQQSQQEAEVERRRGKLNLNAVWRPGAKRMVPTAQAVARQFQLTFGCTRLQEREFFCSRLQGTL